MRAYLQDINSQANARDYLMSSMTNLPINTINSIKLQSSSLAQLTQATNQLTRNALVHVYENFNKIFLFFSL